MEKSKLFRSRISSIRRSSEDLYIFTRKELYSHSCLINKIMRKMYANSYLVLIFVSGFSFSQNDSLSNNLRTSVFSFTPKTKTIGKVNGLTFGFGIESFINNPTIKKVNGLNLEVNPLSVLIVLFADPRGFPKTESCVINGLHISSGNLSDSKINGVALSAFNINHSINGFSVNGIYSYAKELNGFHISGIYNKSETANGVTIAFINESESMKGFQLGAFNQAKALSGFQLGLYNNSFASKGLQIGLINVSKKHKGLQIGLWNINHKRSMPFINW